MTKKTLRKASSDKWLFYNLVALIAYLPIPFGSQKVWAWSLTEAWIFSIFACWLLLFLQGGINPPKHAKKCWLPIALLSGFSCVCITQLIPLGFTNYSPISILGEFQWPTISLEPHATTEQLLKTLSYTCLSWLVIVLVNSEKRLKIVLGAFFLSGLFQAVYGSLMTLTNLEYIFFTKKYAYIGKATGTFVNRNHFANYLVICVSAGTALLLLDLSTSRSSNWKESIIRLLHFIMSNKMLLRIGLAMTVVGIVLSRSRMGNTSLFVSLAIAGFIWLVLTKRITRNTVFLLASLILIDLLIVGKWFGFEEVQARLQGTSLNTETRDEVVRDTRVYIADHPLLGTGGGSYYAVYPGYKSADVNGYYNHTHNDYLQFLSEYGLTGTLFIALFVLSSAYTALMAMKQRKNPVMQAVSFSSLMVVIALLIHSLVDFNLQIMANAASTVIILSLAWISRHLPSNTRQRSSIASKRR